jgi:hypothetical protein
VIPNQRGIQTRWKRSARKQPTPSCNPALRCPVHCRALFMVSGARVGDHKLAGKPRGELLAERANFFVTGGVQAETELQMEQKRRVYGWEPQWVGCLVALLWCLQRVRPTILADVGFWPKFAFRSRRDILPILWPVAIRHSLDQPQWPQ